MEGVWGKGEWWEKWRYSEPPFKRDLNVVIDVLLPSSWRLWVSPGYCRQDWPIHRVTEAVVRQQIGGVSTLVQPLTLTGPLSLPGLEEE